MSSEVGAARIQHVVEPIDGSASALHARTSPALGKITET